MPDTQPQAKTVRALLLERYGLAFLDTHGTHVDDGLLCALEIELAALGFAVSTRLRERLSVTSREELTRWLAATRAVLAAQLGADRQHEPLFRRFPDGIPSDTVDLWITKVVSHFLQADGQPCLFCRRVGTTHVLNPCRHVVCDHCFDGANYSACPVCEHHVDRSSPFFLPSSLGKRKADERVTLKLLDLGGSVNEAARELLLTLCERKQALSPDDRVALAVVVREYGVQVLPWLPAAIAVRENVAIIFGTLFQTVVPHDVLPVANRYLTTATDVLRLVAVMSGADGSLQGETVFKPVVRTPKEPSRWWGKLATLVGGSRAPTASVAMHVYRFKVAKLPRSLRRALLALLDGLDPDRLVEDMLRHRSYWVWLGQFLHPHEWAARFPSVARAFAIVRKWSPDHAPAPEFHGYYARLERAMRTRDLSAMLGLLDERPGELARRFDHALRLAGDDPAETSRIVAAFVARITEMATPVLLTLGSALPTRTARADVRVYWPKGQVARGVSSADRRAALAPEAIEPAVRAIQLELLRRFAAKPALADLIVDEALRKVPVPFNERTASQAAVALPRGSRVHVPMGRIARLFLHWCQPEKGDTTDLDLSVGFYDQAWRYMGVCSYYELTLRSGGTDIAISSGDLRDGPFPDGATEFVDVHCDRALAAGYRYAVMVVNNYHGMPFGELERAFAGLMWRDDVRGPHFDPRTVELRFNLTGANGIFLPFVLDLHEGTLHWLDVHARGGLAFNNVESSNSAITKVCPELMGYFASGIRPSMYDLALLHAAARAQQVSIRGTTTLLFTRGPGEQPVDFLARLTRGAADETRASPPPPGGSSLALLCRDDLDLPEGSQVYALFRGRSAATIAASDLIS